jgi:hypothetical protein
MTDPNWPDEPPATEGRPKKRSALRRIADDIAVGSAVVGSDQMPEIQAAKKFEAEKPVEPGVLGLVPGWIWLAIVVVLVVFFAFFVEPQPFP